MPYLCVTDHADASPKPRLRASFTTWALFLLSNASAVAYALVNKDDWAMAALFLGNAAGCATIIGVGLWKRARHRYVDGRESPEPHFVEV